MNQFRFREHIREASFHGDQTSAQRAVYRDALNLANWWCMHSEASQEKVIETLEEKVVLYTHLLYLARAVTEE